MSVSRDVLGPYVLSSFRQCLGVVEHSRKLVGTIFVARRALLVVFPAQNAGDSGGSTRKLEVGDRCP